MSSNIWRLTIISCFIGTLIRYPHSSHLYGSYQIGVDQHDDVSSIQSHPKVPVLPIQAQSHRSLLSVAIPSVMNSANMTFHCDNGATTYVSQDNKESWVHVGGETTNWGTPFTYQFTDVSASTVVHVQCRDWGSVGGFIATIWYNGQSYSTTEPLSDGLWELINSTDKVTSPLIYLTKTTSPWGISTADIASDAKWVWNGGTFNTILFEFAFDGIEELQTTATPTRDPTTEPTPTPTSYWTVYEGYQCAGIGGIASDLLRDWNGTASGCKEKCIELGVDCVGFVRVNGGETENEGRCYFRYAALADIYEFTGDDRDCFVRNGFYTLPPTTSPSRKPTNEPTQYPSNIPTELPTQNPIFDPTTMPTTNPTASPTSGDLYCGDETESTSNGDWEYYIHINNDSIVTFDTCSSYLNLFSMRIYILNGIRNTLFAECIECGSICMESSQFIVDMMEGTYLLVIDGAHQLTMECMVKSSMTTRPTSPPTVPSPTTIVTPKPTMNPTTSHPTASESMVTVTFQGDGIPIGSTSYLSDPFGRFEAFIIIFVDDSTGILGDNLETECTSCFVWQYQSIGESEWKSFEMGDDDISVSIKQISDGEYRCKLVVQSIRRLNAGNCVDEQAVTYHPFREGTTYRVRLKFTSEIMSYFVSEMSNEFIVSTNTLPFGGECIVQNMDELMPLDSHNLYCDGWIAEEELEYNALIGDSVMSTSGFVDDPRKLKARAPSGNETIMVLVKEMDQYNAITCYAIHAEFRGVDVMDNEGVEDVLNTIENITNSTSLSENPHMAISIHSVLEDMYQSNMTSRTEAMQIVDDMVSNILRGSRMVNMNDSYLTVNMSGDDIITELATVSSITSNEEIVDADSTTMQLVEEYLPDIFDAVDLYIDSSNNITSNSSSSEVQDALYSIGEQSQALITNLEATLIDATNSSNVTSDRIDLINALSESLVDYATLAASNALAQSDTGETFSYEATTYDADGEPIGSKKVNALKFGASNSTSAPSCGSNAQRITLPLTFMTNWEGIYDCVFMASTTSNFVPDPTRNQNRSTVSRNIVTADIRDGASRPRQRRRRLRESVKHFTSECDPYLISIKLSDPSEFQRNMTLGESSAFPSCDFWNINESYWDTEGCFVYDVSNDTVICGCTHLTTFSVSGGEILPEANMFTEIEWRNLNIQNLIDHPTVWITCLCLFVVIAVICVINPLSADIQTKSVIAYEDIIFKSTQDEKLWKDVSGKEIQLYSDFVADHDQLGLGLKMQMLTEKHRKSTMLLTWNLFKLYLRNGVVSAYSMLFLWIKSTSRFVYVLDHTVLSLFQRTCGTNWSLRQRLACFYVYICTIMVATGTFYGADHSTLWQDLFASFIISITATTPGFIFRKMFEYSKPREERFTNRASATVTTPGSPRSPTFDGVLSTTLSEIENQASIKILSRMRHRFYEWMFPLPSYCKIVAWVLLVIWTIGACITAIVYGLYFDVPVVATENENNEYHHLYQNGCWNSSLLLRTENELSDENFKEKYEEREAQNSSGYGGSDTGSWLLSLFQSLMMSIFLWQPLVMMLWTLLCVWMFTWNLQIS